MHKFNLGRGNRNPVTLKDWAEMITDRFQAAGVTLKEEDKEEAVDVLRKSLEEFYSNVMRERDSK